jgi:Holliday junction resolvasome RuvABC endonuclease subunit
MKAAIDYSMSSPAVCVQTEAGFKLYALGKKTFNNDFIDIGVYPAKIKDFYERAEFLGLWVSNIFKLHDVKSYMIEGYAFGGHGLTRNAEHAGILKYILKTHNNIPAFEDGVAPSSVKKNFIGKGKASKIEMCREFERRLNISLEDMFNFKFTTDNKIPKPLTDFVDAYAIFQMFVNSNDV